MKKNGSGSFLPASPLLIIMLYFTGNILTGFDLTNINKDGLSLIKQGEISLTINFKQQLTEPVNVIVFTVDQTLLTIDSQNNVAIST